MKTRKVITKRRIYRERGESAKHRLSIIEYQFDFTTSTFKLICCFIFSLNSSSSLKSFLSIFSTYGLNVLSLGIWIELFLSSNTISLYNSATRSSVISPVLPMYKAHSLHKSSSMNDHGASDPSSPRLIMKLLPVSVDFKCLRRFRTWVSDDISFCSCARTPYGLAQLRQPQNFVQPVRLRKHFHPDL